VFQFLEEHNLVLTQSTFDAESPSTRRRLLLSGGSDRLIDILAFCGRGRPPAVSGSGSPRTAVKSRRAQRPTARRQSPDTAAPPDGVARSSRAGVRSPPVANRVAASHLIQNEGSDSSPAEPPPASPPWRRGASLALAFAPRGTSPRKPGDFVSLPPHGRVPAPRESAVSGPRPPSLQSAMGLGNSPLPSQAGHSQAQFGPRSQGDAGPPLAVDIDIGGSRSRKRSRARDRKLRDHPGRFAAPKEGFDFNSESEPGAFELASSEISE
jgi:hypothetical protein